VPAIEARQVIVPAGEIRGEHPQHRRGEHGEA
jgi:hypothetical protein